MPDGIPRYVRCYDYGECHLDRFTVVFGGRIPCQGKRCFPYLALSVHPSHPQGVGQHGSSEFPLDVNERGWAPAVGRKNHLGTRIKFEDLPSDCQKVVINDYEEIWGLSPACPQPKP